MVSFYSVFSHEMFWMKYKIKLDQFLRVFLPTFDLFYGKVKFGPLGF